MKKQIFSIMSMIFGAAIVFVSLILINDFSKSFSNDSAKQISQIQVQKKKPKPKAAPKPKKKTSKPKKLSAPMPPASLTTPLSGLDFDLPAFSSSELDQFGGDLLNEQKNVIMTDDSVDKPPQAINRQAIPYPASARAQGVEGYVVLSLLIDMKGEIERVKIIEASPSGVFDQVVEQGIHNWKFQPAIYQGVPVKVWARQKIRFNLG